MSTFTEHLAKHLRELHFGTNWTWVNLKDTLSDVTWQEATQAVKDCNSIAKIAYHLHYYIHVTIPVLQGEPLDAHDKFSWEHPPVNSREDWDNFLETCWKEAEQFAELIEQLPEEKLWEIMDDPKYGNYFRNIQGIIEHSHYHLGQMTILKKIIRSG